MVCIQNPQNVRKLPYKIPKFIETLYAADDFTTVPGTLQNERRRRKFCSFRVYKWRFYSQNECCSRFFWCVTKVILPYKRSAAGDNFAVSERYKGDFTLQNERRRRKFYSFRASSEVQRGFWLTKWAPQVPVKLHQSNFGGVYIFLAASPIQ